jgi:hypothetical protein
MEMKNSRIAGRLLGLALVGSSALCPAGEMQRASITNVFVEDFKSAEPQSCRPSDVPLDHARARDFFQRARKVDYRVIHDHYDVAPCYVEGTLKYRNQACEWRIRAGATAHIRCGKETQYFVCDKCEDLFRSP